MIQSMCLSHASLSSPPIFYLVTTIALSFNLFFMAGVHRAPVWNQEFQFLVKEADSQSLEIEVRDSNMTGRAVLGHVSFPLANLPPQSGSMIGLWLPVKPPYRAPGSPGSSFVLQEDEEGGEVLIDIIYRVSAI